MRVVATSANYAGGPPSAVHTGTPRLGERVAEMLGRRAVESEEALLLVAQAMRRGTAGSCIALAFSRNGQICQSALNIDPLSASKIDPPEQASWGAALES